MFEIFGEILASRKIDALLADIQQIDPDARSLISPDRIKKSKPPQTPDTLVREYIEVLIADVPDEDKMLSHTHDLGARGQYQMATQYSTAFYELMKTLTLSRKTGLALPELLSVFKDFNKQRNVFLDLHGGIYKTKAEKPKLADIAYQ